jgi:hypothetical protein
MEQFYTSKQGRDHLKTMLHNSVVEVRFLKADGTERVMKCTLQSDVIIAGEKKTERTKPVNEEVLNVWDVEKDAWRSFRLDAITNVNTQL